VPNEAGLLAPWLDDSGSPPTDRIGEKEKIRAGSGDGPTMEENSLVRDPHTQSVGRAPVSALSRTGRKLLATAHSSASTCEWCERLKVKALPTRNPAAECHHVEVEAGNGPAIPCSCGDGRHSFAEQGSRRGP